MTFIGGRVGLWAVGVVVLGLAPACGGEDELHDIGTSTTEVAPEDNPIGREGPWERIGEGTWEEVKWSLHRVASREFGACVALSLDPHAINDALPEQFGGPRSDDASPEVLDDAAACGAVPSLDPSAEPAVVSVRQGSSLSYHVAYGIVADEVRSVAVRFVDGSRQDVDLTTQGRGFVAFYPRERQANAFVLTTSEEVTCDLSVMEGLPGPPGEGHYTFACP